MRRKLLILAACIAAMAWAGCDKDDSGSDDFSEDKKEKTELDLFYESIEHRSDYKTLGYYDTLVSNIPAGIYYCVNPEGDYPAMLLCKGTDGSMSLYNILALQEKSAFIGSNLYVSCRADDGKGSSYWIYNDQFGKSMGYKPAPSYHKFEYLSRQELLTNDYLNESNLTKISFEVENFFAPKGYSLKYSSKKYELHSEKTEYLGIPCTHYFVKLKEGETYDYEYEGTLPVKLQEWWLTDKKVCLKQYDFRDNNLKEITGVEAAGTLAQNFEKVMAKYSIYPDANWNTCLVSHKKYANEWLYDEYPRSVDDLGLIKYEGKLASFEVNRRAWQGYDNVISIIFTATECTADDTREYIRKVKQLNLSNQDQDEDEDREGEDYTFISYEASNRDATNPDLGETVCYPAYGISFRKWGVDDYRINQMDVQFDVARLTAVK